MSGSQVNFIDPPPVWYIGIQENEEGSGDSVESLNKAQALQYDMVAKSITTKQFQKSVQDIIISHKAAPDGPEYPIIPALVPPASLLVPNETIGQVLAITSSWIDLCSPDPLIANLSLQVFNLEVAYASFCGIQNIIVPGPQLTDGSIYTNNVSMYARAIDEAITLAPYVSFHISLPMSPHKLSKADNSFHLSKHAIIQRPASTYTSTEPWVAWEAWDTIRSLSRYHSRLSLALLVPKNLPLPAIQSRWYSEPLKVIVLSDRTFIPNKHSQPVLHKQHQALLTRIMRLRNNPWLLLNDVNPVVSNPNLNPTPKEAAETETKSKVLADPTPHLTYLRDFQSKQPAQGVIEKFGAGYQDYLQMPLQPLADNLESVTYEVFEKDPVKYELYEQAISQALFDWNSLKKSVSSDDGSVVIAVVGAGRGPLVTRALHAAEISGVKVQLWAVEKNPNAYFLLQRTNHTTWNGQVSVVKSDMRSWKGPLLSNGSYGSVDILVSELLGSFGDNELSPECLDGIQRVLSPQGISIPTDYVPYVSPISTPKIFADLLSKPYSDTPFDLPYVVMLQSFDFLSYNPISLQKSTTLSDSFFSEPTLALKTPNILPAWTFEHPINPKILEQSATRRGGSARGGGGGPTGGEGSNAHNNRFTQLRFPCQDRGVCHGFAGYFESILYRSSSKGKPVVFQKEKFSFKDNEDGEIEEGEEDEDLYEAEENTEDSDLDDVVIELSTNPLTIDKKSKDMISWFPIFFPIETPLTFPDNSELIINVWRQTDDRKVWYEWLIEASLVTDNDKRIRLGSSRLHSTREKGCLM